MTIEGSLKAGIRGVLNRLGLEVRRPGRSYYHHADAFIDQRRLLQGQADPTIIDAGANRGQTIRRYLETFPLAQVLAFEPSPEAFAVLLEAWGRSDRVRAFAQAVADRGGTAHLFLNSDDVTNSLLHVAAGSEAFVDSSMTRSQGSVEVPVVSLDAFCAAEGIARVDILKMDIQGAELRALRGASRLLSTHAIGMVYSEVLFATLYDEQAHFCALHGFLEGHGYRLYGLYNLAYGRRGLLGWADALYVGDGVGDSGPRPGF